MKTFSIYHQRTINDPKKKNCSLKKDTKANKIKTIVDSYIYNCIWMTHTYIHQWNGKKKSLRRDNEHKKFRWAFEKIYWGWRLANYDLSILKFVFFYTWTIGSSLKSIIYFHDIFQLHFFKNSAVLCQQFHRQNLCCTWRMLTIKFEKRGEKIK